MTHPMKADDHEYGVNTVGTVEDNGDGWIVIGWDDGFFLGIPRPDFKVETGMKARLYGRGLGFPVRGVDIDLSDGDWREVYYLPEEEDREKTLRELDEFKRKREQDLADKGGVDADWGSGRYRWQEGMGEISGFGGEYEAACRAMLMAGLEYWDERERDGEFDPHYQGFEGVYGVMLDDNEGAKALDAAIMDAEIIYGNGTRERAGDGASGAMHQAVVSSILYIRKQGWDAYVGAMSRPEEVGEGER